MDLLPCRGRRKRVISIVRRSRSTSSIMYLPGTSSSSSANPDDAALRNTVELMDTSDGVDLRYRALGDVATALASYTELDDLFLSLRSHLDPLLEFSFLAVALRDPDGDGLIRR